MNAQVPAERFWRQVCVSGSAATATSCIAMAGDEVAMPENAFLMIHAPAGMVMGTATDMRAMAEAAPLPVRVVARRADAVTDFGDARRWSESTRIVPRLAEGRLNTKGRAFGRLTRPRRGHGPASPSRSKTGRGVVTAPIFLLMPQAKLPKRLDMARDAEQAHDAVPGLIVANWVEGWQPRCLRRLQLGSLFQTFTFSPNFEHDSVPKERNCFL